MGDNRKLIGGRPVIGIRPTIDGREGALGVRKSLEEQTMGMALKAKKLFEENLKYSDGTQITAEKFNDFYASIQSIYAEDFTDKEVSVEDAPIAVTFHTTRAGFETITLRLAPYDRNFYVSQDGALVNIRDAEKIIRTFKAIREK